MYYRKWYKVSTVQRILLDNLDDCCYSGNWCILTLYIILIVMINSYLIPVYVNTCTVCNHGYFINKKNLLDSIILFIENFLDQDWIWENIRWKAMLLIFLDLCWNSHVGHLEARQQHNPPVCSLLLPKRYHHSLCPGVWLSLKFILLHLPGVIATCSLSLSWCQIMYGCVVYFVKVPFRMSCC